jgi:hypothetical protein
MVEEEKQSGNTTLASRRGTDESAVKDMHADVNAGMIFFNLVAFFSPWTCFESMQLKHCSGRQC